MRTYVVEIGGKAALAFRAETDNEAEDAVEDEDGLRSDLRALTGPEDKPLWDGKSPVAVRRASAAEHAEWEQWAGDTCFGIWQPEKQGMPFVAQKGNPWPLRCDDVAEMRAALEAKGVQFLGDTFDTGVCHMAIFADPDGNRLMLHRRYAPHEG